MTVRGEHLLQDNKPASDDEESDEDDTVVLGETSGALTVKERRVVVTVWVLMRVIVVTLNFHHHQLKEGAVPEVNGVPQVLLSVEFCTSWHILRPSSFTTNWNINLRTRTLSSAEAPAGIP